MRRTINYLFAMLVFTTLACKQDSPYDNSTPEKLMQSLSQIVNQPKDQNPVPFFYAKKAAEAIMRYDASGGKALKAFDGFKNSIVEHFPKKVKLVQDNKIELHAEGDSYFSRSFTLSATLISNQLQDETPKAYEYVSASEPDEDGIVTLEYMMEGTKREMKVVKESRQYLMYMPDKDFIQLEKMVTFFSQADSLFSGIITDIENKTLSNENFQEKSSEWNNRYMALFKQLN